jgi:chemotaxis response regulator CheB
MQTGEEIRQQMAKSRQERAESREQRADVRFGLMDAILIGVVIEGLDVLLRVLENLPARESGTLKAGRRKHEELEEKGGKGVGSL